MAKTAGYPTVHAPNGTIVYFDGFSPAFHFVFGPGGGGAANKMEGKLKVSLYLVAPPQAAARYRTNGSFCWSTTLRNKCQPLGKSILSF